MITHKVIDLVYHENNVVMNGSLEECQKFMAKQSDMDSFTYKIEPLLPQEIKMLNEYEAALNEGKNRFLH